MLASSSLRLVLQGMQQKNSMLFWQEKSNVFLFHSITSFFPLPSIYSFGYFIAPIPLYSASQANEYAERIQTICGTVVAFLPLNEVKLYFFFLHFFLSFSFPALYFSLHFFYWYFISCLLWLRAYLCYIDAFFRFSFKRIYFLLWIFISLFQSLLLVLILRYVLNCRKD